MSKSYKKALVEVLEVIKYSPDDEKKQIPKELIRQMENEKDKNYYFSLDRTQKFDIQISENAKAILANLFKKYWANEYELKVIKNKENINRYNAEQRKRKLYPVDNIFKKNNKKM